MPSGVLVIGVGGAGRGVLNFLKKSLEDDKGSLDRAGAVLLGIDGPREDQYVIHGYQIDTQTTSKEFYQFTKNPGKQIDDRNKAISVPYFDQWLSIEAAKRTPTNYTDPTEGLGGVRTVGRGVAFLEATDLRKAISEAFNRAARYAPAGTKTQTFIVGSFSGGAGAGTLVDIAHITRDCIGRDEWLNGVICMPTSFAAVTDRRYSDAKGFAGLREVVRLQGATAEFPTRVEYSKALAIEQKQLFNTCFLVDGTVLSETAVPLYGTCPAIADLIYSVIVDTQGSGQPGQAGRSLNSDWRNFVEYVEEADDINSRFNSFGVHSYVISTADILSAFSWRFAKDTYDRMITVPATETDRGESRARRLLQTMPFTSMAVDLADGVTLPLQPRDYVNLLQRIKTGNNYTNEEVDLANREVPDFYRTAVKAAETFLSKLTNSPAISQVNTACTMHVGQKTDPSSAPTNYGALHERVDLIAKFFVVRAINEIKDIFYKRQDELFVARSLSERSYTLAIAWEFLSALVQYLGELAQRLNSSYEENKWVNVSGRQVEMIGHRRQQMENIGRKLAPNKRDRQGQEDYSEAARALADVEIWVAAMEAARECALKLKAYAERMNDLFGSPISGWQEFIKQCRDTVKGSLNDIQDRRAAFAKALCRTYVPEPNGVAENEIYKDRVLGRPETQGVLYGFLGQLSWNFYAPREIDITRVEEGQKDALDFNPEEYIASFDLLLKAPSVPGYDPEIWKQRLHEVFTGRFEELAVHYHSYFEFVKYGENKLEGPISAMTIWDGLRYHQQFESREGDIDRFADYVHNRLADNSKVLLETGTPARHQDRYEIALQVLAADEDATTNALARAVCSKFNNPANNPMFRKRITRLEIATVVPYREWANYLDTRDNYVKYTSPYYSNRANTAVEVHVDHEERNARRLEHYLMETKKTGQPVVLDASVVRFIKDSDAFQTFALLYATGGLPNERSSEIAAAPKEYYIDITGAHAAERVRLGETWNLGGALATYCDTTPGGKGQIVRDAAAALWQQHEADLAKQGGDWRTKLVADIRQKANALKPPSIPPGNSTSVDLDDLIEAFYASIMLFASQVEAAI